MRAAGSHHAARLHYGHLRKHFVVSDGPRLQDEQSPQRTFFDGWPLCLGKQAPQFFFFIPTLLSLVLYMLCFLLYWLALLCVLHVAGSDLLYHST